VTDEQSLRRSTELWGPSSFPGAVVLLALAGVVASSCYHPTITEGGFACSAKYKQECPETFHCSPIDNRCYKNEEPDAAVEQVPDGKMDKPSGTDVPAEAPRPDAAPEAPVDKPPEGPPPVCIKPVNGCAVMTAQLCDPVCQSGCACEEKCSVNATGTPTCNVPSPGLVRLINESCTVVLEGDPKQTDNCAPGLVCVTASCGSSCFKHCRTDGDCPAGAPCTRTIGTSAYKFCDVPAVTCNPVTKLGDTGCPGSAQGCYLSATVPDETRCDCPFRDLKPGDDCSVSRQCLRGLVCADPNGQNHLTCQIACNLTVDASKNGCGVSQTCLPIKTSKTYGVCAI
jgi:hypothetical protein